MGSFEEKVEDFAKRQLDKSKVRYFTKTESINAEIDDALKNYNSKSGGNGNNYPDIKVLIEHNGRVIPVMIEVKGKKDRLSKFAADGSIDMSKNSFIEKYALNGAFHYAKAIFEETDSYKKVIFIAVNGYEENKDFKTEFEVYYLSDENLGVPKKLSYSDLSFLATKNLDELFEKIDSLSLTDEEKEKRTFELEDTIEKNLKSLNQEMQDVHSVSVSYRVQMIAGMIMAGLGVPEKVSPLEIVDLKGDSGKSSHDGCLILSKIESFLAEKLLPQEKRDMIKEVLSLVFLKSNLHKVENGESKLKKIYSKVKKEILPFFNPKFHVDFTGRLFNVLNAWVDVPDGAKNDVVLTPRYVCELMTKLCKVDKNSFVWDYATGSAGFLISAMKIMIADAQKIESTYERNEKICKIKAEQLLGVEKLPDVYMLAVLNMILMGDGSSNIIHKDSLTEFTGNYEMGENKDKPFPANVFLLNPPYSAPGKGFNFVEKAFSKMKNGRAAILIQENAGSGNGLPYTKNILKNSCLVASIHNADIFCGKAGVQTAIYVFDVGTPHNADDVVTFIDFSNDGYSRQNRKKSSAAVNLRDTDCAKERYEEVVDIVLNRKKKTNYFSEENGCVIYDTISLDGNDWTFSQHKKIDTQPTLQDFKKTVADFLAWKVSTILKEESENSENFR